MAEQVLSPAYGTGENGVFDSTLRSGLAVARVQNGAIHILRVFRDGLKQS